MAIPARETETEVLAPVELTPKLARPKRKKRWPRAAAVVLLVLITGSAAFLAWFIHRPWPEISGTLRAAGLQAPVEIVRDRWGTPHIYAQNTHDLFFAQGYAQAQDRLWQMEFTRQMADGTLSSFLGAGTLRIDKTVRTLGLRRTAERDWSNVTGEEREVMLAFSEGVNAYRESHRGRFALEFSLFRIEPAPWTPQDTLATVGLISWILSENAGFELSRAHFIAQAGAAATKQLLPPYNEGAPFIIPAEANHYAALRNVPAEPASWVDAMLGTPGPDVGSNSWTLRGDRTASGAPLLANDTHLDLLMPSSWYASGLHAGDIDAVGFSFVGSPGIVLGHNSQIAWGITDLAGDVQDFYVEKFDDPDHPQRYEFRGQWRELVKVTETIQVKDASPVILEVQSTHHGPVISNLGGRFKYPEPLALAWTGDKCETAVAAVIALNRAKNWEDFRAALELWDGPDLNFLYADRDGNIGYQAAGRMPIRGPNHSGAVPVPGWTGEYEWKGYIPVAELPHELNPSSGFIVAANQKATSDKYPYRLGYEFADPFRAIRIGQLLSGTDRLGVDDMKKMQGDNYHLPARELIPYLSAVRPASEVEKKALEQIRSWDLHCSADQSAPAIFQAWYRFLVRDTVGDELGPKLTQEYMEYYWVHMPMMIDLMKQPNHKLFDDIRTPQVETRDDIVRRSFNDAVNWLTKEYGPDLRKWQWGSMHPLTFRHRPLGLADIPVVSKLFNYGPIPDTGCDRFTVNPSWFSTDDDPDHPFTSVAGTSQRIVMDLSSWDNALAVNSTGQSEHLFHPHRDDDLQLWRKMEYHPLRFTRNALDADGDWTLKLLPTPNKQDQASVSDSTAIPGVR